MSEKIVIQASEKRKEQDIKCRTSDLSITDGEIRYAREPHIDQNIGKETT
jgi:hypothetical protein